MTAGLANPRRALEIAPARPPPALPRPVALVLVLVGAWGLGLGLAQRLLAAEAHLLHHVLIRRWFS